MGDLTVLQNYIQQKKQDLEVHCYQDARFLKVTKYCAEGIKFLPNFYLIFNLLDNEDLCMRVLTYHGRTLSTVFFKFTDSEIPDKVAEALDEICGGGAKVCKGLVRSKNIPEDCLVEYFNDTVIARSFQCSFLNPTDNEQCNECQRLVGIKKDVDLNHIDSLPPDLKKKPKIEPPDPVLIESFKVEGIKGEQIMYDDSDWNMDYDPPNPRFPSIPSSVTIDVIPRDFEQPKMRRSHPALSIQRLSKGPGKPRPLHPRPPKLHPLKKKVVKKEEKKRIIPKGGKANCQVCLKVYMSDSALTQHSKTHEKYFDTSGSVDCPLCKVNMEKLKLTEHFQQQHSTEEESLTCCLACLEVIPHKNGDKLQQHIFHHHQHKNVCEICGKNFEKVKKLECHIKTKHFPGMVRFYTCYGHDSLHTPLYYIADSKDVFCDRCGKGFGHEIALKQHLKVACAMEEWVCKFCSKTFVCRKKLRMHLMVRFSRF